ncbi:MAG TPA: IS1 family transposase [Thermoanaerobaculia bacterium]|nr:IS1 family transposase [Thermoanaerobaculia bacterium]
MARPAGKEEPAMVCHLCRATTAKKYGRTREGHQRYRCRTCRKTFSERPARPLGDMRIPLEKALPILQHLCEGSCIRALSRASGCHQATILRLLVQVGEGCERMLAELVRDVEVKDVQADEVWTYIRCKEKTRERRRIADPDAGDSYCFIGLERHTKMVLAFHVGRRDAWSTHDFMAKLAKATAGRLQLTTDGFGAYPDAVHYHLGARADYAMLIKDYGAVTGEEARRYAPPRLKGTERIRISGQPEQHRVCTSHVERGNWTIRGNLRRFTRLSNGFSRKKANLRAAVALYFAYYNLCRMHSSIRMTPAMKAGIARKPWTMAELVTAAMAA